VNIPVSTRIEFHVDTDEHGRVTFLVFPREHRCDDLPIDAPFCDGGFIADLDMTPDEAVELAQRLLAKAETAREQTDSRYQNCPVDRSTTNAIL
jgi:hypothetical protein